MPIRRSAILFLLLFVCPLWAACQTLGVTPGVSALTIHPGDSGVAVPFTLAGGTGPVTVTITGLPSGITVAPVTLSGSGSGTLLLTASVAAGQEGFPATNPANPNTYTTTPAVVAVSGGQQSFAPFSLTVSLTNPDFTPAAANINLPIVRINTGGVAINSKTVDVPGTVTITSANGQTSYLPGLAGTDNTATFHVHGFSTSLMPKLPYNVKLNTSTDLLSGMGLQCGYVGSSGKPVCDKSKSYILLANYDDKTMLRDWAASALANAIPFGGAFLTESAISPTPSGTSKQLPWASHSLYVELFLNGQYEGTYQLIEEVKVDTHRVNITEMAQTTTSGTALTGGYLMEIDQHMAEDFLWTTPSGLPFGLLDPDYTPEVPEQTSYIQNYVDTAENALLGTSFTDPTVGWRAYFDQASLVNFYLVNDVMGNVDGGDFYSSNYLYKNVNNPLIYMGPVWDFDISSGNVNYFPVVNPTVPWIQTRNPWYPQLFKDPGFKQAAQQQWNALKSSGILTSWLASIPAEAATLQQTQRNNFGRWPMQGILVWPNPQASGSYDAEVSYLLNWVNVRVGFIDAYLNQLPATTTTLTTPTGAFRAGSPASVSATVTGASPTGAVTFTCNGVVLGQAALGAGGVASLTTSLLPPGSCLLAAVYNGDANNALSSAAGTTVTVLPRLVQSTTNLTAAGTFTYGSPSPLTAVVVGNAGATAPTGTVTFSAAGTVLGVANLSAGSAVLAADMIPAGTATVTASYGGDANFAASSSNAITIAVAQGTPALTWPQPAPIVFGTALSGTQYDATSNVLGSFAYSPAAGTVPAVGSVTLTTVFTPSSPNYTTGTQTVVLTVSRQPTTVTLAAGPTDTTVGQTVALNAIVNGTVSGTPTPTGTVTFYDGSTALATVPLSGAVASYMSATLPAGDHLFTATYSGDTNYLGNQSAATGVGVGVVLGLSLQGSGTLTVPRGGSASLQYALAPSQTIYPGQVVLSVTGVPSNLQFTLSPAVVQETAGPANITLTITAPASARLVPALRGAGEAVLALLVLSPLAGRRMRQRGWSVLALVLFVGGSVGLLTLGGCGSSSSPAQTFAATVTATSRGVQQSVTTNVTVQ